VVGGKCGCGWAPRWAWSGAAPIWRALTVRLVSWFPPTTRSRFPVDPAHIRLVNWDGCAGCTCRMNSGPFAPGLSRSVVSLAGHLHLQLETDYRIPGSLSGPVGVAPCRRLEPSDAWFHASNHPKINRSVLPETELFNKNKSEIPSRHRDVGIKMRREERLACF
jgi:hypothetical protein